MKKAILFLVLPLLLLGCAQKFTNISVPDLTKSDTVLLKDLRPDKEKENETFSYLITSEAYGIGRVVDGSLVPPMTRLLQHRAYEKMGNTALPIDIKVHHMVVYSNMKSQLRKGILAGTIAGPLGVAVAAGTNNNNVALASSIVDPNYFESTIKDEYKRALYSEKENPNAASVFVTYIDAEITGKRVFIKTMTPVNLPENQNPHIAAIESAIKYYLDQY